MTIAGVILTTLAILAAAYGAMAMGHRQWFTGVAWFAIAALIMLV